MPAAPPWPLKTRAAAVAAGLTLLIVAGLDYAYFGLHWGAVGQLDDYHWGLQDFRDAVYYPCRAVLEGVNPYDVQAYLDHFAGRVGSFFPLYSPLILLLHAPLALLPYSAAGAVYQTVQFGLLLLCCGLSLHWCGWRVGVATLCALAALVLLSEPGRTNLNWGQVAWPLVLGSYLALAWSRERPAWAGAALALVSFKPTYLITIGVLMLCRRDWKALAYGVAFTLLATLAGFGLMAACGIDVWEIPRLALSNHAAFTEHASAIPSTSGARVDVTVFLAKVCGIGDAAWPMYAVPALVMLATGWLVWSASREPESLAPDSFTTFLLCVGSMLSIFHMVYDLIFLTLPILALFTARHSSWKQLPTWGLFGLRMGAAILAFNVLWTGPAVRIAKILLAQSPETLAAWSDAGWHFATLLNAATLTALWLLAAILHLRHGSGQTALQQVNSAAAA